MTNGREFDDIQKVVLESYENGEFSHLTPAEVPDCGDGLLKFMLAELSRKEDCGSLDEALNRLNVAIRELTEVACAVERESVKEAASRPKA